MADERTPNKEKIYDEQVAPLLFQAAQICERAGLSMVAAVEYGDGKLGHTMAAPVSMSPAIFIIYSAIRANGNADLMTGSMIKEGEKRGHQSAYLTALSQL